MKQKIIIFTCVICIILFSSYSMGKVNNSIIINTKGNIANPIIKLNSDIPIRITNQNRKGTYNFQINNYEQNKITDVNIKYNLEIIFNYTKYNSIKLYKDNQEIKLKNNKTEDFILQKNDIQQENYKLEIEYNNEITEDIVEDIQIKLHWTQI